MEHFPNKKESKGSMGKRIRTVLIVVLVLVFAFSGYQLYRELKMQKESADVHAEMEDFVHIPDTKPDKDPDVTDPDGPNETEPEETAPPYVYPAVDFAGLKDINEECVGWIYIEDTRINYPVMQGKDNDYYLNHLITKKWNGGGSIFMDYRVSADIPDQHTILYGHRLKNGNMFHGITKYKKQSYYESHPTGFYITPEQTYLIEFFSAFVVSAEEDAWKVQFATDEEYGDWLQRAKDRSLFKSPVSPTATDKVITMSTCTYEIEDARFVLLGILIPI